jgi:hypothetical protein
MRRRNFIFAAVLVLIAGIASAVAFSLSQSEERAPESLLPADSVVYFGWDGTEKHKADWEKSACYESLDKTKLLKTIADFALSYIPADSPVPESAVRQLLSGIARRGISLSLSVPNGKLTPRVVVVLHQAADLQPAFDAALPQLFKGAQFEVTTIRGRRVNHGTFHNSRFADGGVVSTPGAELAWWAEGGHLVIAFGEPAVDAELDVADGKAPPITQTANWRKFRVEPTDFQAIAAGWCDVAALRKSYGDVTIQEKNSNQPKFTVGQLIDVLGGGQLGLLAMRTGLKDRALVSEFTLDAPAPRSGVLALADQAPISLTDLPPLPHDNTGFVIASFNWSKAYDTILGTVRKFADAVSNGGADKVDGVMKQAPAVLGFDPKTDLVDALGHVVCVYSDAAAGIPGGLGFSIALSVEKPDVLKKTLKTGFEKLQAVFPNGFTTAEEERSGRPAWIFDLGGLPVHPAVVLDQHWLIVGLSPQSVESALLRLDGKLDRWKPSPADQAALDTAPKEFVALSLSDPRPLYTTIVTYLPMVGGFLNQTVDRSGPTNSKRAGARMALLSDIPPAEVVTRPMFPNVAVVTVDGKGVRMRSRESAPGLSTGAFVATPVMVALLLPAVQAARAAARRTQSKNNLKQIGLALHNYHATEGSFPAATYRVADLKPDKRLSWQTEILPYLEQKPLYDRIDFKKSWDDAANHAAVSTPLVVFINPMIGEQNAGGLPVTEYVGLAGVGEDGPMLPVTSPKAGVFAYNRVTRIEDIVDGTSNTIMTSECNKDFGSWAAGGRPTIRALTKKPYIDGPDGLGGQPEGVQVGFADGSVRFVSKNVDPQLLERLVTIAGHEQINIPGQ